MITNVKNHILAIVFVSICYSTFLWWQQDDFYIHLQYAKNFSHSFIWAFNSGIVSYGTTSPLWVLLLSCFGIINLDLIIAAKILSLVLGISTFVLLFLKAVNFKDKYILVLCVFSLGLNHWYRLAVGSGMEATLASVLLTILFLRTYYKNKSNEYSFINGVIIGLCVLVRPEFVYLVVVFLFMRIIEKESIEDKLSKILFLAGGLLVVILPWLIYAQMNFNSIVPTTVLIKTGHHLDIINVFEAIIRVSSFYLSNSLIELFLGIAFVLYIVQKKITINNAMLLRIGIVVGIPVIYLVNQSIGGESISYRYAAPTIPIIIFSSYKYLDYLVSKNKWHSAIRYRVMLVSLLLIILLPNLWLSMKHAPYLIKSNNYLNVLEKYGRYLKGHSAATDTVACYDVGAIGYFSDRYVLDLVGLVSPETIKYKTSDVYNISAINAFAPKYLIVPWLADMNNQLSLFPVGTALFKDYMFNYRFQIAQITEDRPYIIELRKLK